MYNIDFTKINPEEIAEKTLDSCQVNAKKVHADAGIICKEGVFSPSEEASPALMRSIFRQVQDPNNWKRSIALVTPTEDNAKLILAAIIWHHAAGKVNYLNDGSFMIVSPGYSSR